ncbi:hypothetical protein COT97_04425 [Candidatus Falkowbacteria bacterium CG10_big_fil_rev_8_21_14_0_10_39_11]|uniref:Peptidase M23 domain-containing protein n=1 Tax=Candidatus Falkowbacteria bacterium CG10_big_fil_rev_8_21_14_0_10_39_11 TaxID=1974565 RepID=A0A2H0V442_9BACT|nr:MAG: hypothetical protein COT97_04425 [Candidatus Falkowbacteria bacterium CG10_big_fil_rev_8_21_14_0_10_39_11]
MKKVILAAMIVMCWMPRVLFANSNDLPMNYYLLFPLQTNWWNIVGFGFGEYNSAFGAGHLAEDTIVSLTPTGTPVFAPCSGRVVISDNQCFGGYGSDSSANANYCGYLVLIECRLENNVYVTTLLGHLQSGSSEYDQNAYRGLVPLNWNIKAGEYVGRVADYWHGNSSSANWHHLHFGIRRGRFDSNNVSLFVLGYLSTGWTGDQHVDWVAPTEFILDHQGDVTWHADGTLVQVYGQSNIYQLIDGVLYQILNGDVFEGHNFAWNKVMLISQAEFNCYERDASGIDWAPWRRLVKANGQYYLHEKRCATCTEQGMFYQFSSLRAVQSWNYAEADFEALTAAQVLTMRQSLPDGGMLYLREGTLIRDGNNFYVMTAHGVLRHFERDEYFWRSGYAYDRVWEMSLNQVEDDIFQIGFEIDGEQVYKCLIHETDDYECELSEILVSYSGPADTENIGDCMAQVSQCANGLWITSQTQVLPTEEVGDNRDNDCDGETDEGLFVDGGDEPDVIDPEDTSTSIEPADSSVTNTEINESENDNSDVVDDIVYDSAGIGSSDASSSQTDTNTTNSDGEMVDDDPEMIICDFGCPEPYQAHVWYGEEHVQGGFDLTVEMPFDEICLRSAPWIDFNCALPDWRLFDPDLATINCNAEYWSGLGLIDFRGEGEIWFTAVNCL